MKEYFNILLDVLDKKLKLIVVVYCFAFICFINANDDYIARPNIYIKNALSRFENLSTVGCCTKCSFDKNCLAVNYKDSTSECEFLAEHPNWYLDRVVSNQDWTLFTKSDGCGGDWLPFNQNCYLLNGTPIKWHDADSHCKALDAELVDIHSPQENAFVSNYSNSNAIIPIWIGLYSPVGEETFYWTSGRPLTYTAYRPGEPDSSILQHRGVSTTNSGDKWNDRLTEMRTFGFLCKRPVY